MKKVTYTILAALLVCGVAYGQSEDWNIRVVVDPPDMAAKLNVDMGAIDDRLDDIDGGAVGGSLATLGLEIGTDVQAYDADLDTWATVTPSVNGKSFVAGADYATMRGLIDLEIGTDVQQYDVVLSTYAGITPSTDVQTLLGAASVQAFRGLIDLEIGTDIPAVGFTGTWTPGTNGSATLVDGVITTFADGT